MTRPRALAAAQTIPVRGNVARNLAEHVRLVEAAARERAGVLVFPELSLTGYELDLADELAFSEGDTRLAPLSEAAASHGMTLVVGAPMRIETRLFIGAFLFAPDGTTDLYTKHHLAAFSPSESPDGVVPPPEPSIFEPGARNPLVRLGGSLAAVAICADTSHPSHAKAAAERGARSYLAGSFTIPADLERKHASLASYAAGHRMAVVFANYGGPSGGLPSGGCSAIWSEHGERLAQLDEAGAGLVVSVEEDNGWHSRAVMLGGL